MSRRPNQNAIRAFVEECFEGTDAPDDILDKAVAFLMGWCSLTVQQQFCLQQRAFGKPHEVIAREYRATFHQSITPAGVCASCYAATQAATSLAPDLFPTTSAPTISAPVRGISSSANRKSVNRRRPHRPPQAPV